MSAEIYHLGDPARHFWLTRSVARAMGLSLYDALSIGDLAAPDYADLVTSCRKCPNAAQCELWLSVCHQGPVAAPEHCRNRKQLEALQALAARH